MITYRVVKIENLEKVVIQKDDNPIIPEEHKIDAAILKWKV
ncbi:MAG: hypothetical protein WC390_03485 [Sulfurimonas sp.]|jgi:hypothetical protein